MPKDFTLSETANHARIVPCLGHQIVVPGQTVAIPDEFVDGLRGQDDWQPSGWTWPPETVEEPAADPAADAAAADPAAVEVQAEA